MTSKNQTQPNSETPCCMDPNNGFCSKTKTFYSLRAPTPFPSPNDPLSLPDIVFSLLQQTSTTHSYDLNTTPFLINSTTGKSLTYTQFLSQTHSLSLSIKKNFPSLSKNDVALIVSPTSFYVPVLYFALLSLGVIISPTNPLGSDSELSHQIQLSRPKIAFATSRSCSKLLSSLPLGVVVTDSPEFSSWLTQYELKENVVKNNRVEVAQSDIAAILYSSGTTGKVKGVPLTHRNLITLVIGMYHTKSKPDPNQPEPRPVSLSPLPLFHVFGFSMLIRAVTFCETLVLMDRFEFEGMLRAVEKYKATYMPVAPPLIVALVKSDLTRKYDLSSLMVVGCGGAPLGKEVADKFKEKFPDIEIVQGYGLTETGASAARLIGPEETKQYGSCGRLSENMEAKIVDPTTGEVLPPGQRGELWLRGPTVMNGYVGDHKATAETLNSEGWLKTGDLCYFDSQGFLYIVDRLKELIKYKGYQVPPAELEHLLQSHPEIADAAVIPYPDDEAGEIPMAYVVRKPGSNLTAAQVMDHVAKQVAPYKKIRRVAFVSSIPKSPAGKILRRELVNQGVGGAASKL